ncbi:MAG: YCF48-related protein [Syntrophothermus sp.]
MKKLLLLIIVLISFLFIAPGYSQNWVLQTNPLGASEDAMTGKIKFVSLTEGWVVTKLGGFLHTTNGGTTWILVKPFPNDTVVSACDPSNTMSWVGTTHGWNIYTIQSFEGAKGAVIFKTTNGGINWEKKVLSTEAGTYGVQCQFVDENIGWALTFNFQTQTPTFLKTTDGGNNWSAFNGAGIFYFINSNVGYAYYGSGINGSEPPFHILKTNDGGMSYTEVGQDNTPNAVTNMIFVNENTGWMVGKLGKVLKTTNGGVNWNSINIGAGDDCKAIFFLNENLGWISSKTNDFPVVHHTTDGGASWTQQSTPFSNIGNAIFSIYFFDEQHGWLSADWGRLASYTGITSINEVNNNLDFKLSQNYPNPFNPSTTIKYQIPQQEFVTIKLFDALGNQIAILENSTQESGSHSIRVDAGVYNLTSGIYFYYISAGDFQAVGKMMLLK